MLNRLNHNHNTIILGPTFNTYCKSIVILSCVTHEETNDIFLIPQKVLKCQAMKYFGSNVCCTVYRINYFKSKLWGMYVCAKSGARTIIFWETLTNFYVKYKITRHNLKITNKFPCWFVYLVPIKAVLSKGDVKTRPRHNYSRSQLH